MKLWLKKKEHNFHFGFFIKDLTPLCGLCSGWNSAPDVHDSHLNADESHLSTKIAFPGQ